MVKWLFNPSERPSKPPVNIFATALQITVEQQNAFKNHEAFFLLLLIHLWSQFFCLSDDVLKSSIHHILPSQSTAAQTSTC